MAVFAVLVWWLSVLVLDSVICYRRSYGSEIW